MLGTAMTDGLCDERRDSLLTNTGRLFLSRSLTHTHTLAHTHTHCCSKGSRTALKLCDVLVREARRNAINSLTTLWSCISATIFTLQPEDKDMRNFNTPPPPASVRTARATTSVLHGEVAPDYLHEWVLPDPSGLDIINSLNTLVLLYGFTLLLKLNTFLYCLTELYRFTSIN